MNALALLLISPTTGWPKTFNARAITFVSMPSSDPPGIVIRNCWLTVSPFCCFVVVLLFFIRASDFYRPFSAAMIQSCVNIWSIPMAVWWRCAYIPVSASQVWALLDYGCMPRLTDLRVNNYRQFYVASAQHFLKRTGSEEKEFTSSTTPLERPTFPVRFI